MVACQAFHPILEVNLETGEGVLIYTNVLGKLSSCKYVFNG